MSVIADDIIPVEITNEKDFHKSAMIEYGFVEDDFVETNYILNEESEYYPISTKLLTVFIQKQKFNVQVSDKDENLVLQTGKNKGVRERMPVFSE